MIGKWKRLKVSSKQLKTRILSSHEDLMFLIEAREGSFSVKLHYKVLDGPRVVVFPHRFILNTWVPSKRGFFV